jgi:hypothetical protein
MTAGSDPGIVITMPAGLLPIVVGVDGTERSVTALRWASFEALQRDTELVALHAFGRPWQSAPYAPAHLSPSPDSAAGQALALLDGCLRAAFGDRAPVPVRR